MRLDRASRLDERRTKRALMRRVVPEDFDDLARMHGDSVVMVTLGGVRHAAETAASLKEHLDHWRQHGFGLWVARDHASGEFLGYAGLCSLILQDNPEVELLYGLVSSVWGRGLATELGRECLVVAFSILRRRDLVGFTLHTNLASQRVLEKLGFRYEREGLHARLPHRFYRLTESSWRAGMLASEG